jgi:hypothetical protein
MNEIVHVSYESKDSPRTEDVLNSTIRSRSPSTTEALEPTPKSPRDKTFEFKDQFAYNLT